MTDHAAQKLTPREMIRAHAYPVLAAVSTVALVVIAVTLAPIGKHAGYQNRCIEESVDLLADRQDLTEPLSLGFRYVVRFCNGG